jgi:hypothetical protein
MKSLKQHINESFQINEGAQNVMALIIEINKKEKYTTGVIIQNATDTSEKYILSRLKSMKYKVDKLVAVFDTSFGMSKKVNMTYDDLTTLARANDQAKLNKLVDTIRTFDENLLINESLKNEALLAIVNYDEGETDIYAIDAKFAEKLAKKYGFDIYDTSNEDNIDLIDADKVEEIQEMMSDNDKVSISQSIEHTLKKLKKLYNAVYYIAAD